jgi:hypothetical protein
MLDTIFKKAPVKVARYLDRQRRRWTFDRAMRQFLQHLDSAEISLDLLHDLVHGWNNPWSAQEEYIQAFLRSARSAPGPILECGSGLSTILLGAVAQRTGNRVWCLEHDRDWSLKLRRSLDRYLIGSVEICLSAIVDYGSYSWYAPPLGELPNDFALAVCDGPPGTTPGGRYGFLPVMGSRCRPGCEILLDDANRLSEQEVLERWARELGTSFAIEGEVKPYGRIWMNSQRSEGLCT